MIVGERLDEGMSRSKGERIGRWVWIADRRYAVVTVVFTVQQVQRAVSGSGDIAEFHQNAFRDGSAVGKRAHILGESGQPLERGEWSR